MTRPNWPDYAVPPNCVKTALFGMNNMYCLLIIFIKLHFFSLDHIIFRFRFRKWFSFFDP